MQECFKKYTLSAYSHVEILKCLKPNSSNLAMALLQKFIFDFVFGIYTASAALTLYAVFDYLTFEKTVLMYFNERRKRIGERSLDSEDRAYSYVWYR